MLTGIIIKLDMMMMMLIMIMMETEIRMMVWMVLSMGYRILAKLWDSDVNIGGYVSNSQ